MSGPRQLELGAGGCIDDHHPAHLPADLDVLCPHCDRVLDRLELRDTVVAKLMGKILALRSRLADVDPTGGIL